MSHLTPEMQQQLEQLKDIQLPEPVSWWPLAYGWWVLIGLVVCALAVWLVRRYKYQKNSLEALALNELAQIEAKYVALLSTEKSTELNRANNPAERDKLNVSDFVSEVSALIKRVLAQANMQENSSKTSHQSKAPAEILNGKKWQDFLIDNGISDISAHIIAYAPYQQIEKANLESASNLQQVVNETRAWIRRNAV